jgi:hypothetical protein
MASNELCLCGDPRPCPHLDPLRCEQEGCGHPEEAHIPYGACTEPQCGCRQFISHALYRFWERHGPRTFDEWLDGRELVGLEELVLTARELVEDWSIDHDIASAVSRLASALRPFRSMPPPSDYAPRCVVCNSTQEHVQMTSLVAGYTLRGEAAHIICCDPQEVDRG